MTLIKEIGLLFPLVTFGLLAIHFVVGGVETTFDDQTTRLTYWILCCISGLLSLFVLVVHWIYPPHPKFMLLKRRYFCIKLHVAAGSIEFFFGVAAMVFDCKLCAQVMAGAALFVHIPTAIIQTRLVFGSRGLMIPSYILCVLLHGYCAVQLWNNPSSEFWLVQTYLIFSVYAWVRFFYFAFKKLRLFDGWAYSVAVLSAGATMAPAVLGPAAILFLVSYVLLYLVGYWLIWQPQRHEVLEYLTEHRRETYFGGKLKRLLDRAKSNSGVPNLNEYMSDRERAEATFEEMDTDNDGILTVDELSQHLSAANVPKWMVDGLIGSLKTKEIPRQEFFDRIWRYGLAREIGSLEATRQSDPRERAALIFRQLDLDRDGFISGFELAVLLLEWDLPPSDVEKCLIKYGGSDNKISSDEFYKTLKPIWNFAYCDVVLRALRN